MHVANKAKNSKFIVNLQNKKIKCLRICKRFIIYPNFSETSYWSEIQNS